MTIQAGDNRVELRSILARDPVTLRFKFERKVLMDPIASGPKTNAAPQTTSAEPNAPSPEPTTGSESEKKTRFTLSLPTIGIGARWGAKGPSLSAGGLFFDYLIAGRTDFHDIRLGFTKPFSDLDFSGRLLGRSLTFYKHNSRDLEALLPANEIYENTLGIEVETGFRLSKWTLGPSLGIGGTKFATQFPLSADDKSRISVPSGIAATLMGGLAFCNPSRGWCFRTEYQYATNSIQIAPSTDGRAPSHGFNLWANFDLASVFK